MMEMFIKVAIDRGDNWDEFIPAALLAYCREVPNESTGYPSFNTIFGRKVTGRMSILRSILTREAMEYKTRAAYDYLLDLNRSCKQHADTQPENQNDLLKFRCSLRLWIRDQPTRDQSNCIIFIYRKTLTCLLGFVNQLVIC